MSSVQYNTVSRYFNSVFFFSTIFYDIMFNKILFQGTSTLFGFLQYYYADITKTCLYNFDPLKPHFYIVKMGFTGVYIIFIISAQNIDCGYSLEPPRRGGSNEYPQSMF